MSLGRRKVGLDDPTRWVFNRMADVYDARPPYPTALVDALAALAPASGLRVADLGAGIGHLALLARGARGFDVTAVEPARDMLDRLSAAARARDLPVRAVHATAEATPLDARSVDLVVVADALHFIDAQLVAEEIARVLRRGGALAVVTAALGDTPYMRAVRAVIDDAVPRRPRALTQQLVHVAATAEVSFADARVFHDETPLDHETLERVLRSISFIGPAMHAARFAAFRARVHALPGRPVWARTLTLRAGRRARRREAPPFRRPADPRRFRKVARDPISRRRRLLSVPDPTPFLPPPRAPRHGPLAYAARLSCRARARRGAARPRRPVTPRARPARAPRAPARAPREAPPPARAAQRARPVQPAAPPG